MENLKRRRWWSKWEENTIGGILKESMPGRNEKSRRDRYNGKEDAMDYENGN